MENKINEIKNIKQYLRSNIGEWIKFSVKICNGKCIVSGQPFNVIHHKYPFHKIVEETFKELNINYSENIDTYSEVELKTIKEKCLDIHFKYGAGACLTEDIHKEFHNIFGNNITIEDFDKFIYYKQNNIKIDDMDKIFNRKTKQLTDKIDKTERDEKLNNIREKYKNELLHNLEFIRSDNFQKQCPITYNNIKRNIKYLEEIMLIALENIDLSSYYDKNENMIFFTATSYICTRLGLSINSSSEISNKIALFAYHKLINKLDENDTPKNIIKTSQIYKNNKKGVKHIGCYSIPSYKDLLKIESQARLWKQYKYTMSTISYEMFYRGEGIEKAQEMYPQYKKVFNYDNQTLEDRTISSKNQEITNEIIKVILNKLEMEKYITLRKIINLLSHKYNVDNIEKQYEKSIKEIMDSYNLKKIKCNKIIKERYGVTENSYPFIIVKNEE